MKVLFYRYNSICEPDFIDAFKKIGLEVSEMTVEMYRKDIPGEERVRLLLERIVKDQPLFVFSIDYFPFISMVCERVGIIYAALSVDCPVAEIYSKDISDKCNRVFLFDRIQHESVQDFNPGNIRYMPLGAAVDRLDKLPFPDEYRYGVSFIGSTYEEKDRYLMLVKSGRLRGVALERLEMIISRQVNKPGLDLIEQMITDADIEALKAADPEFYSCEDSAIDMDRYVAINNYIGNHLTYLDRKRILNRLASELPSGTVHLFTRSSAKGLSPDLVIHDGVDTLTQMPEVFRSSKINLNLTSRTIRCGLPQRIWDILGCRAFCLTDSTPAMDTLLQDGRDLKTFDSYDSLHDAVLHCLENDEEREEIAITGFENVAASHTVLHRALEIVKIILSEKLA
ncbi:MAG: DUF3880 domain-containing protein [Lachnospiraceae bacterium]|nr:DUF3880 domain-containing protein [Lachnospiraceae bacterium]